MALAHLNTVLLVSLLHMAKGWHQVQVHKGHPIAEKDA